MMNANTAISNMMLNEVRKLEKKLLTMFPKVLPRGWSKGAWTWKDSGMRCYEVQFPNLKHESLSYWYGSAWSANEAKTDALRCVIRGMYSDEQIDAASEILENSM